jgi:hypothetical protein
MTNPILDTHGRFTLLLSWVMLLSWPLLQPRALLLS